MNNFLTVYNKDKDPGGAVAGSIKEYLESRGCVCSTVAVSHDAIPAADLNEYANGVNCVIVLGGDGTLIQVAGALADRDIPLLGINLGTLGYLAEVERDNIMPTLDRLINDDYDIEERMMLSAATGGSGSTALNDIVISRLGDLRIVRYMIYVNNRCLSIYEADGIIVSTPTGSTGYNLSAGGPIVEPNASLILVTPICPHTLNTRAVVLSADDEIRIEVLSSKYSHEYEACLSCDGATAINLKAGDRVEIKKAEGVTKVIKMSREGFLDVLSRKLGATV
ncbi:MAG: NAD(+)/NADH kinase [Lachnospiraceae bacterium]|nr:NAD(+)/NADH kinase [Lachnospiraceae bacterium]MBR5765171.1 NAD(+)/NADH kinase [Lachnospiraceae bacterium]MBR6469964.1 NAD(+)/NADH kinase [Lachnospiraceae bacterium]